MLYWVSDQPSALTFHTILAYNNFENQAGRIKILLKVSTDLISNSNTWILMQWLLIVLKIVYWTVFILHLDLMKDWQTQGASTASKYAAVPHACK